MNSFLDYLSKTATAIGERVITDRLDYARDKRNAQLAAAAAPPAPAPQPKKGLPAWVIPASLAGVLVVLLLIRRKQSA